MSVREIRQDERLESLLEPTTPQPAPDPGTSLPKLALPHMNLDDLANFEVVKYLGIRIIVIVALLWFGLTSTGSVHGPAFGRFAGDLAMVFYQWQVGNLLAMVGVVIAYDTVKRFI